MVIYFDTSGYTYDDCVGSFYPPGMPKIGPLVGTAERTLVFAHSYCRAQAIDTICQLRLMLG